MAVVERVTAEELFRLGPEARFDLIEGILVEYPLHGGLHGMVLAQLATLVASHVRAHGLGTVYLGQVGHILDREPDTVLAPDLSFIRKERDHEDGDGFLTVIPNLIVEVLEPYESSEWIDRKTRAYLDASVDQVWIVDPLHGDVELCEPHGVVHTYHGDDVVLWREIFPGLSGNVADILGCPVAPISPSGTSLL